MRGGIDDDYRVVVDEESLDWRGQTDAELNLVVDLFADLLQPLTDGKQVAIMTMAYSMECWESVTLPEISFTADRRVSRDARVRLARLFDKCRVVDPQEDDIPQLVQLCDIRREPSWGMAHALARAAAGRAMSCIVGPLTTLQTGWTTIERTADGRELNIHLLSRPAEIAGFWRGIFEREPVFENIFFALAELAFPRLVFAPTLMFRRFRGSYNEILPWIIRLLSAVDDHFADAVSRYRGDQNQVMAEFSTYGVEISPDSPQTRRNARAWAERLVTYEGVEYRCEWHGKRLWNHDRVHFSLPIAKYQDRVLIGIFTDHLL